MICFYECFLCTVFLHIGSFYVCLPGDKLKPSWVTDDMDVARHQDKVTTYIRHNEIAVTLPATMGETPDKLFFSFELEGVMSNIGGEAEARLMEFVLEQPG
eukprot:Platyproteum_vivax@DN5433_c0_g1_i2.p1